MTLYTLENGMLPLRYGAKDIAETLIAYVALYLEEEIQAEGLVRRIEPFTRFLQTMSFSHGSILNLTNIGSECHVKRTTVQNWLTILEDILIAFQIPVFTTRAKRALTRHPKFYFFDTGIFQTIRPTSLWDKKNEIDGAALEGLIAQHLRAWKDYTKGQHNLSFWRTRSGLEVDFILMSPLGLWAVEVKNSPRVRSKDLHGLKAFANDYPEASCLFLYRGKERLRIGNIWCLPCEEFLRNLTPNQPIDSSLV